MVNIYKGIFGKVYKLYRYLKNKLFLSFKEKHFGKMKYIYERNGSDKLMIVFSGFGPVPKYNYMRTLSKSKIDKLFLLDNFGYQGSYYWYENGGDEPKRLVIGLIERIRGGYKTIYTAGSSKGGTCALYFGLMFNVEEIFCSSCQYHVGDYLNKECYKKIMEGMMGTNFKREDVDVLNSELPNMIKSNAHSSTLINLYYSQKDHTYQEHIVDLIKDLKSTDIHFTTTVDDYVKHTDNGYYFSDHLKKRFCQ